MRFVAPAFLWLLLLASLLAWIGWPRTKGAREVIALVLRLALLVCLVLALAGLEVVRGGDELAVVFLLDVSDSMSPEAVAAGMDYVRGALEAMGPDDQGALVLFAAEALVERPMSPDRELGSAASAPSRAQSDLAGAIRLATALFPPGAARRIVILSDGAETSGEAFAAAQYAAASGVQIVALPLLGEPGPEALVAGVDAPDRVRAGERFDLAVSLQASEPMAATLRVLGGGEVLYEGAYTLRRGAQTLSLPLQAGAPGFVSYQVQLVPGDDGFYQNNRMEAVTRIEGPPRVLLAAPVPGERLPGGALRPDESSPLLGVLAAAGYQVEPVTPAHLPIDLPSLAGYNAVVLVDVPARMLGLNQMDSLQAYVRDLGGGLVVVGGPTSFGVGGYYDTPLEEALPVDMQLKDEQRRPSLAIVFVIDHSGSMSETSGGVTKLELAKEAAARSAELLFPTDRVGVVAFDDTASWVVPMTDLYDLPAVVSAIGSLQPGGGTDILAGLHAMARELPDDPARVKHVILLTDGGANPAGIPELVKRLYEDDDITLSTVAVGRDAAAFLEDLAELGGGRYHFTVDPQSIPSIFTEETTLATRAYLVEEPFLPELVSSSPVMSGISATPRLYGYVATSPKALAQVVLQTDKEDPLLAVWQYGLGRALAFTSDASGRWAKDWVRWGGFPTFWAAALRETIGEEPRAALAIDVRVEDGQARLTLGAYDRDGGFLNGYRIEASLVAPDGATQTLALRQVAPGRYETEFRPEVEGGYLIHFSAHPPEGVNGEGFSETTGWTLAYSPEYLRLDPDPDLLLRLALATGGSLASSDPAQAFAHDLDAQRVSRPVWPWLLGLAALLLPFDVAARRLIVTRQDLARLRAWLLDRTQLPARTGVAPEPRSQRMQSLLHAKGRVTEATRLPADLPPKPVEPQPTAPEGSPAAEEPESQEGPPPPAEPAPSTTEALLARKKTLREKQDSKGRR